MKLCINNNQKFLHRGLETTASDLAHIRATSGFSYVSEAEILHIVFVKVLFCEE